MSDMTRAEAIKVLQELWRYKDTDKYAEKEIRQALSIAINSLQIDEQYDLMYEQAEPNCPFYKIDEDGHGLCKNHRVLEQEPCGDAISRQIISDYVQSHIQEINTGYGDLNKHTNEILRMIVDYIEIMSSVKPQEPKYCDRNICIKNEYNGIGCDECEVTKSQGQRGKMLICPECGLDVHSDFKTCPRCGAKMAESR